MKPTKLDINDLKKAINRTLEVGWKNNGNMGASNLLDLVHSGDIKDAIRYAACRILIHMDVVDIDDVVIIRQALANVDYGYTPIGSDIQFSWDTTIKPNKEVFDTKLINQYFKDSMIGRYSV